MAYVTRLKHGKTESIIEIQGGIYCKLCATCYMCGKTCENLDERDWAVECVCCERPVCASHSREEEAGRQSTGYDSGVRCKPPCAETPSEAILEDEMGDFRTTITQEDRHRLISDHAYRMWERGFPGSDLDHWRQADSY